MTLKAQIELLGSTLDYGETLRDVCPQCGGGSQSEKSLALTRESDGTLVWICHRASCQSRGGTSKVGTRTTNNTPRKKRRVFDGRTRELSEPLRERIYELWGISEPEAWYYTPAYGGRIAMSIRSPKYLHRGWVLRDISGRARTKALTYIDEGEVPLSWYKTDPYAPTVIVEDIPSAVRASTYMNSVALLGTGVGMDKAAEIAEYARLPIIVALDQDATSESFRIAHRYAALWQDVKVLMLNKDLKNMNEEELQRTLTYERAPCTQ